MKNNDYLINDVIISFRILNNIIISIILNLLLFQI